MTSSEIWVSDASRIMAARRPLGTSSALPCRSCRVILPPYRSASLCTSCGEPVTMTRAESLATGLAGEDGLIVLVWAVAKLATNRQGNKVRISL